MMGFAWIPLMMPLTMTLTMPGAQTQTHRLDAHAVQGLRAGHQVELMSVAMNPWWHYHMREAIGPERALAVAMFARPEAQGQGDIIFAVGNNATGMHVLPGSPFVSRRAYDALFKYSQSGMYVMVFERNGDTYRMIRVDHPISPNKGMVMLDVSTMSARMDHGQVVVRCVRSYSPPDSLTLLVMDEWYTIDGSTQDKASVDWSPAFGDGQCSLKSQAP